MSDAPPDPVSGTWPIVETTLPSWRRRTSPSVSYRRVVAVDESAAARTAAVAAPEADPVLAGSVPALFAPPRIPS